MMRYASRFVLAILATSCLHPRSLSGQTQPDISGLSPEDHRSIESACSNAKYLDGPAAYRRCLQTQLDALGGSKFARLSELGPEDRRSIESACSNAKYLDGPAAYHRCLQTQLDALGGSKFPDISGLSPEDRRSIESACSNAKYLDGPAAYRQCLRTQLSALSGPGLPGLTNVTSPAQQSSPEFRELKYFLGHWAITGEAKASLLGPAGKLTGTQRNELGSDGLSLVSHWEEERSGSNDSGQGVYRYDAASGTYTYHSVDASGETEDSIGTLTGSVWTWRSSLTLSDGTAVKGRFTLQKESPSVYTLKFEIMPANGTWAEVMEGRAVKQK